MQEILVVGSETMVGHNWLKGSKIHDPEGSHEVSVVGLPLNAPASRLQEIISESNSRNPGTSIVRRVVHCGGAGENGWAIGTSTPFISTQHVSDWARVCHELHLPMTLISSDAIFTGPWMFHPENSESMCPSPAAAHLRELEAAVLDASAGHLVVRTHSFGWHHEKGWLEQCLGALSKQSPIDMETTRHASPIYVRDLISMIQRAWAGGLSGTYHISGAERISCAQFVHRLAQVFHLEVHRMRPLHPLEVRVSRFAAGETSLQTRKIRRALGISMPMFMDSLYTLRDEAEAQNFLNQEMIAA